MIRENYNDFSFRTVIKLMDLKTLVAGITPVILGSVYSKYKFNEFNLVYTSLITLGIILAQGATNMINDYFDYRRGADNNIRGDEKALVSGEASPKQVLRIIVLFELMAFTIGLYIGSKTNYNIMIIAIVGAIISVAYASGPMPISYLPIGEIVSGVTMGIGITSTVIFIQSGVINVKTILIAIPTMLYISTVLLSNNMSDIKEDKEAGRKTLPILLGVKRTEWLWLTNIAIIYLLTIIFIGVGFYPVILLPFMLVLFPYKGIYGFLKYDKNVKTKGKTMGLIGNIGIKYHISIIGGLLLFIYFN